MLPREPLVGALRVAINQPHFPQKTFPGKQSTDTVCFSNLDSLEGRGPKASP